jgi:hypothetical protein
MLTTVEKNPFGPSKGRVVRQKYTRQLIMIWSGSLPISMLGSTPDDSPRLEPPQVSRMDDGLHPLGAAPSIQQATDSVFHLAHMEVVRDGNNARVPHVEPVVDGNFHVGQIETSKPFTNLDETSTRFLSGNRNVLRVRRRLCRGEHRQSRFD